MELDARDPRTTMADLPVPGCLPRAHPYARAAYLDNKSQASEDPVTMHRGLPVGGTPSRCVRGAMKKSKQALPERPRGKKRKKKGRQLRVSLSIENKVRR